jgi:hypothetical protein
MKTLTIVTLLLLIFFNSFAQVTTNKVIGEKNEQYLDSVKNAKYPYILPIWGQKAFQKGFKLQLPAGLSLNYLTQKSDIIINNLQVGFNNGPKYNLDEIVRFNSAQATTNGLNFRPDIWLLPFLNIYGIIARSKTSTSIDAGLWVPENDSTWTQVLPLKTKAEFDATTLGFGITPTMGIGGFFLAFDMNFSWSNIDELDKAAFAYIFDPRLGKNFAFKNGMNLAIWTGGFRVKINSGTSGSLNLNELFSSEDLHAKIDNGFAKVDEGQQNVDEWWNNLSSLEQKNPTNIAKYNAANKALETAGNILAAADNAVNTISNSTVQYSLDKKQKQMWNFIVGGQLQFSDHWMIRAEVGFLASRTQGLASLQYRFGL